MIPLRRRELNLLPDTTRVILRPFIPSEAQHVTTVIGRTLALTDCEVACQLNAVREKFGGRHMGLESLLQKHYEKIHRRVFTQRPLSPDRQLLLGALFSGEYALESTALFNPSIVAHPDQAGVPPGDLRFVMSLRATGEGHISSIEFRSGTIEADGRISIDAVSPFVHLPEVVANPSYQKDSFATKLIEMGVDEHDILAVVGPLAETFTRGELDSSMTAVRRAPRPPPAGRRRALECIQWLAESNYELRFSDTVAIGERIIYPVSRNESNGIEDARFVRFTGDDGSVLYYGTYTAYNGRDILPQLIETEDFLHFRIVTLNGTAAQNKGMALFPRQIRGHYAMLSRQDDENIFVMFSDSPHFWSEPRLILRPAESWESVKIGNCGSPIETEAGWLVITHGVGPMRTYCIGAALLDREDPTRVIGRLRRPLLAPEAGHRDGYVPNVVYSCGSLLHGSTLVLPFAVNDRSTTVASVPLNDLLNELQGS